MDIKLPSRKTLDHSVPGWVEAPEFFITVCCRPRAYNHLCYQDIARNIFECTDCLSKMGLWNCELLVLMPDHLHLLASSTGARSMAFAITRWKRWIAWQCGISFQNGFFDHRLRSIASACEKWTYVYLNPVRKGLVSDPEDWPYIYKPKRLP